MEVVALSGTVGAGKTTIALALRDALLVRGLSAVELDVDAVAQESPSTPDDPFNERAVVAHLRAHRAHWTEAGLDVLLLAGVEDLVVVNDGRRPPAAAALEILDRLRPATGA